MCLARVVRSDLSRCLLIRKILHILTLSKCNGSNSSLYYETSRIQQISAKDPHPTPLFSLPSVEVLCHFGRVRWSNGGLDRLGRSGSSDVIHILVGSGQIWRQRWTANMTKNNKYSKKEKLKMAKGLARATERRLHILAIKKKKVCR